MPKHTAKINVNVEFDLKELKDYINDMLSDFIDGGTTVTLLDDAGEEIFWTNHLYEVVRKLMWKHITVTE
jgi:hypothetical protein